MREFDEWVLARELYLKNPTSPGAAKATYMGSVGQHTKPHPPNTQGKDQQGLHCGHGISFKEPNPTRSRQS